MKTVALLVWFDEPSHLLYRVVRSWSSLCDAVVAVDGAFEGFPGARTHSGPDQAAAIHTAAGDSGMELILSTPTRLWRGHPEKRTFAWRLGEQITTENDWFAILDADEEIAPGDHRWDHTSMVATLTTEVDYGLMTQPRLMRATRGVNVEGLHYRYAMPDGRFLWNYPGEPQLEPVPSNVRIHHRRAERGPVRLARAKAYYRQRRES